MAALPKKAAANALKSSISSKILQTFVWPMTLYHTLIIPPPPPVRHAQPVHCPLPSAIEQAAANDEAPPAGRSVAGATG